MPVPTAWHSGELAAQQARGFEDDVWGAFQGYQDGSPGWMTLFLSQIPFLSLTTLDEHSRPWTSLITFDGNVGFISGSSENANFVDVRIRAPQGVPIRRHLQRMHASFGEGQSAFDADGVTPRLAFCVGGVGVMMHNRRRNKLEGVIVRVDQIAQADDEDEFRFTLQISNTFGNCPKYINTRMTVPSHASTSKGAIRSKLSLSAEPAAASVRQQDVPPNVVQIIDEADLVFLATMHSGNDPASYHPDPPRLGNNHRGGPAGFLRTYWDDEKQKRCVILPDWSGNRFMMSIGNITNDPCAGFTIPVWSADAQRNSSLLHLSGTARVLANDEATGLMHGVRGIVQLWVDDWTYVEEGFPLCVSAPAKVGWSPYNPPVRLLKRENALASKLPSASELKAHMVDVRRWSDELATFTFELDGDEKHQLAQSFQFGQHVVADCFDLLDTRIHMYSHMARFRGGEKDLNDDGTRSWTITYAKQHDAKWRFELTLRRKPRGGVTPTLFSQGRMLGEIIQDGMQPPATLGKMNVLGLDGTSVLPLAAATDRPVSLTYVLSGIGLTPLLPHLAQILTTEDKSAEIVAIVATRNNEADIVQRIIHHALSRPYGDAAGDRSKLRLEMKLFLLVSGTPVEDAEHVTTANVDTQLWQSLPAFVKVDVQAVIGPRLSADSFSDSASQSDEVFRLPPQDIAAVQRSDCAVVCAAPAFATSARESLTRAGLSKDKIHEESFAF